MGVRNGGEKLHYNVHGDAILLVYVPVRFQIISNIVPFLVCSKKIGRVGTVIVIIIITTIFN